MRPFLIIVLTTISGLCRILSAQSPFAMLNPGETDYNGNIAVYADHADNFFVVTKSNYLQDMDPGAGVTSYGPPIQQVLLAKYTGDFELIWWIHIEGATLLNPKASYVTTDNAIMIAGTTLEDITIHSTTGISTIVAPPGEAIWTATFNSDGSLSNAFCIGGPNGSSVAKIASATIDGSGNATLTGYYTGNVDFDPGPGTATLTGSVFEQHAFFAKYTHDGTFLWAKKLGNGSNECVIVDHAVDNAGNCIVGGWFTYTVDFDPDPFTSHNVTALGTGDGFVAAYDSDGNFIWAGALVEDLFYSGVNEVETDAANNIVIAGFMDKPTDFDFGPGVKTRKPHGTGYYTAKYTSSGILKWVRTPAGEGEFLMDDLYVDVDGNAITCGRFSGTFDFDFSNTSFPFTGPDPDVFIMDHWISSHDKKGNFNYAFSLQTDTSVLSGISSIYSIAVTGSGKLIIAGKYLKSLDIDPGPGSWMISVPGADQANFVIGYDQPAFKVSAPIAHDIKITPNPADELLHIAIEGSMHAHMSIYDLQGRRIMSTDITSKINNLDVPIHELPEGMYVIVFSHDGTTETKTVVVAH